MISFSEKTLLDENKYQICVETDNRTAYDLVRDLLKALVDHKVCSVTIGTTDDTKTFCYICGDVKK